MAENLIQEYPYQIREPRGHAFGMVVLSKHEFLEQSVIPIKGALFENFAIRLKIKINEEADPLLVYALHAVPPMAPNYFKQRNYEIMEVAKLVSGEEYMNIAMIGDWNITPYSPYFSELLNVSGLKLQSTGLFMNPTWPAFNKLSLFKIPIDHVLHSPSMRFVNKEVGPAFGSDHNSIITSFVIYNEKAR